MVLSSSSQKMGLCLSECFISDSAYNIGVIYSLEFQNLKYTF